MMDKKPLSELKICVKGAGEMASGIVCRLHQANIKNIVMLEVESPLAVRRQVSFCEVIYEKKQTIEGLTALRAKTMAEVEALWQQEKIAVMVDPDWQLLKQNSFDVVIDAILAKKNLGTHRKEALQVIGLGPGFKAGDDVHLVIETQRGHNLGRVLDQGRAEPNTGIPGDIAGYTRERVLRAPQAGIFQTTKSIGDLIEAGDLLGTVSDKELRAEISGVIRGLIRADTPVKKGLKLGDIDPRGDINYCHTVSEKARALGGAVLEAILGAFNR